jgi:hypothetical protein
MVTGARSLADPSSPHARRTLVLGVALVALVLAAVALHSSARLSLPIATGMIAAPLVCLAVGLRPSWAVLLLVAIPPGLLTAVGPTPTLVLLLAALVAQAVVRQEVHLGWRSGIWPLVGLVAAALVFRADVGPAAAEGADGFLRGFGASVALAAVAYNAVRLGDLRWNALANAFLVGIVGTAAIKIALTGLGPVAHGGGEGLEALFFGRNFAYLAAVGFAVAFGRWVVRRDRGARSPLDLALAGTFALLVATSLVRGAWLGVALAFLFVTWTTRRRGAWLVVPLAAALLLLVPVARDRVAPSGAVGFDATSGRWELWSALWTDHVAPALPQGNGFGYAWSLSPEEVLGIRTFVIDDVQSTGFLYPHDDFLFWTLELGLWGLGLWLLYWVSLVGASRRLLRSGRGAGRAAVIVFGGVLATMLLTQLVANGIFLPPLADRFFAAAGLLFGMRATATSHPAANATPREAPAAPPAITGGRADG